MSRQLEATGAQKDTALQALTLANARLGEEVQAAKEAHDTLQHAHQQRLQQLHASQVSPPILVFPFQSPMQGYLVKNDGILLLGTSIFLGYIHTAINSM